MTIEKFVNQLAIERGAIVSSAECSEMEIADARMHDRMYVAPDGLGFVRRPKAWLERAGIVMAGPEQRNEQSETRLDGLKRVLQEARDVLTECDDLCVHCPASWQMIDKIDAVLGELSSVHGVRKNG